MYATLLFLVSNLLTGLNNKFSSIEDFVYYIILKKIQRNMELNNNNDTDNRNNTIILVNNIVININSGTIVKEVILILVIIALLVGIRYIYKESVKKNAKNLLDKVEKGEKKLTTAKAQN